MKPKALPVLLLATAALAFILIWRSHPSGDELPKEPQVTVTGRSAPEADGTEASPNQGPGHSSTRERVRDAIRVVDEGGNPLANVRVGRIPRPRDWRQRLEAWPVYEERDISSGTRMSVTGENGVAELPTLDTDQSYDGSLIWACAAGRRAAWLSLKAGAAYGPEAKELVLPACKDIEVRVLGVDGTPVANALVTERVYLGDWPVLGENEREARQFEFLPRQQVQTDALGVARLPVLPGNTWIEATADGLASDAWIGRGTHHVTLRLFATCEIEGVVVEESGQRVSPGGSVSCQVRRGYDGSLFALASVRAGGRFGPVRLPLASEDGFILQYFGGTLEASQLIVATPAAGSRVSVTIATRAGIGVELLVKDEEGRPLANVNATTQWTKRSEWNRVDRRTDADGRAQLTHLPSGEVWIRLRKSGYVPELRQLFRVEQWSEQTLEITMTRAATIRGVCEASGKPVSAFTVYFYKSTISDGGKVDVEDSEDGAFIIDEAAPGLIQLLASSREVVQSAPAAVTVGAGSVGNVRLELPSPRTVLGQVVDALTGEPIGGAEVAVMLLAGRGALKPWKTARTSGIDGKFEIDGLGSSEGRLDVSAPGYAPRGVAVFPSTDPVTNLGRAALHRAQSLVIRLRSDRSTDFTSYGVTLFGETTNLPGIRFPADGVLHMDNMSPGILFVTLECSDGSTQSRDIRIRPGDTNTCDFELDGAPLDVLVIPPDGSTLPDGAILAVRHQDNRGHPVSRAYVLPVTGAVHIPSLAAHRLVLEVLAEDHKRLASGEFTVSEGPLREVTFRMHPQAARLRFVDSQHRPVVGATVNLFNRNDIGYSGCSFSTDASGEIEVPDTGLGEASVSVFHNEHATLPCVPLSMGTPNGSSLEFTMPQGTEVELGVRDGSDELVGVEVELQDSCGASMSLGRLLSGEGGNLNMSHLGPGDYRILVDHPGIWRTEQAITVGSTPATYTIQLRRLGSAKVRVRSGVGNPVEGADIELIDVTTGTNVVDWMKVGDVPTPAGGMRTDASGMVVINGLPRGSYRCVTSKAGTQVERTIEVPAQATGELEVVLQ